MQPILFNLVLRKSAQRTIASAKIFSTGLDGERTATSATARRIRIIEGKT